MIFELVHSVVIGGGDDHDTEVSSPGDNLSSPLGTSSKPVMVGKRLKEYENLMTELRCGNLCIFSCLLFQRGGLIVSVMST